MNNYATPLKQLLNFRIADDDLGIGSVKTKYNFNVAAIKLLKQIESNNRLATSEEQQILSRYVGWGELSEAFNKNKANWRKEYEELKTLLSDEEYEAARASTLSAYYTSPTIIKAIYSVIEKMGFSKGNILEPSMGIGNFFGLLPKSMNESRLYGVELDSISGRIAKQLYQNASITVSGYEKTLFPDNFFDIAVGNVPYSEHKIHDSKYDKHKFRIHDYFFAKTLDQVRPGGVIAFITSKGTMDKGNPEVRKYIAQRAELIGAIRLPNSAFEANAGTDVTADIIFLQKRERMTDVEPDWVHLNKTEDGIPVNSYFAENPHMILGIMVMDKPIYGRNTEITCIARDNSPLAEQLEKAISNIYGRITANERKMVFPEGAILADSNVQNFSFTLLDGELYYRENSVMLECRMPRTAIERTKGLVGIRDCLKTLMDYELHGHENEEIAQKRSELNDLYDQFTAKFGIINKRENKIAFIEDSSYSLLCALENIDKQKIVHKADIFFNRTVKQIREITSVDTAVEALTVSISEKACVDIPYMSRLTGSDNEKIVSELHGIIYQNPGKIEEGDKYSGYETADEYLSGNIREKLEIAKQAAKKDTSYNMNVQALEAAMPKKLTAVEIDARLGATWISPKYIEDFMVEVMKTPRSLVEKKIKVYHNDLADAWHIEGKKSELIVSRTNIAYGTMRISAYSILEDTLNLCDVIVTDTVFDSECREKRILNKKETLLAQQKQGLMKQAFKDWIFRDQKRRDELVQKYNDLFNSTKLREYNGSFLEFPGISHEIKLRKHQVDGIARIMYGGNTLLAHAVGAGKTFEMVAAAMESKRLGLCHKSMLVVPNHLTEQTASEFMRLYPTANILVARSKVFDKNNRKKFCSRIATGEYDAVIIGYNQFEKIPISEEKQAMLLKEQIDEIVEGISKIKDESGAGYSVKQLERKKKMIEARLEILNTTARKDDVVTFEELGVDRLFIDEAHHYKNLCFVTKMHNIAGIQLVDAQKTSDLLLKCRYMDELTGGKGTIFATGTPISNSMTELYNMMNYLQHDTLKQHGISAFDSWASTFGETTTSFELKSTGTEYIAKSRFARFYNLPELMKIFREVADIQTADMLNLPVPKANLHTIVAKPTDHQKEMIEDLSRRADAIYEGKIDFEKDNFLKITTDGRDIGLDQRVVDPLLPDDENSKVNMCVRKIHEIWKDTKNDRLTQLMFCDFSVPNKEGRFNIYDDIKKKLIKKGIPKEEIAFIHTAKTEASKERIFESVRKGQVRVLMGSTEKMGVGTNVQDRLVAIHNLNCPWRPADEEQRIGRGIRPGNMNKEVDIYRYVTESTFDAYLYQTVESKQRFISQIMTSKNPLRTCEDVDEKVFSYAEVKALCVGDYSIREKINLDIEVAKLNMLKSGYQNTQYNHEDILNKTLPQEIKQSRNQISRYEEDIAQVNTTQTNEFSMTVMGRRYVGKDEKNKAGEAIIAVTKDRGSDLSSNSMEIGTYRGFKMSLSFNDIDNEYTLAMKNKGTYRITLGDSATGNMTRIENALNGITEKLKSEKDHLESLHVQADSIKEELKKPFAHEKELAEKSARLNELNIQLNLNKTQNENIEEVKVKKGKKEYSLTTSDIRSMDKLGAINLAKDIMGKNVIVTNSKDGHEYKGEIIGKNETYAIQRLGNNQAVLQEIGRILDWAKIEQGTQITLRRNGGRIFLVSEINDKAVSQQREYE